MFKEEIDLFVRLLAERPVTWSGNTRSALNSLQVFPKTLQVFPKTKSGHPTTWIGVGGSPESVAGRPAPGCR